MVSPIQTHVGTGESIVDTESPLPAKCCPPNPHLRDMALQQPYEKVVCGIHLIPGTINLSMKTSDNHLQS